MKELRVLKTEGDMIFTDCGTYACMPNDDYIVDCRTAECFTVDSTETDINGMLVSMVIESMVMQ